MTNLIPLAIADLELQVTTAISAGDETFSINASVDDDGVSLPAGKYCFTLDSGTSNKEYLIGQLNGTDITSVKSVSRQGAETTGAARAHRVGAPCIVTNFATLQRVADILRGELTLDGSAPIIYDAEPTLADRKEMATVGYVLDTVTGGTVAFDTQTTAGSAGETVSAGDLIYFKTSDQEWYLVDATLTAEVNNVQLGFALGAGTDGVAISGGIQISGTFTTTGLTAGSTYYATDTPGAIGTSAGTTNRVVGVALSTTKLLMVPVNPETLTSDEKSFLGRKLAGSSVPQVVNFTATGTWTKDPYLEYIIVEVQAAGGAGDSVSAGSNATAAGGGGGAGGYGKKLISASGLDSTEAVTVGLAGSNSSFGTIITAISGTDSTSLLGGVGGTCSGGDINIQGGDGHTAISTGSDRDGAAGNGGDSFLGKGGRGAEEVGSNANNGDAGHDFGGGGGGALADNGFSATGGAGAAGIVIVTEYYS